MLYDISINYHERYDGSAIHKVSPKLPLTVGRQLSSGIAEKHDSKESTNATA